MNLDQGAQRQFLGLHVNSMLSFEYTHHFIWRCSRDCWGHALGDNFCRDPGGPACRLKVLATARCGLCFGHKFWPEKDFLLLLLKVLTPDLYIDPQEVLRLCV